MGDMQVIITQTFQEESGRVIALLYAHLHDFELVEDAVQDAFVVALERWSDEGVPRNPGGWIFTIARGKAIDRIRRKDRLKDKQAILKSLIALEHEAQTMDIEDIPDERLKLMFTCCHPALSMEAQVALTLQTLGGLTTHEIANAFLVPLSTMAQRLVRAKRKIRDAGIPYQVPPLDALGERIDSVLSVLYLIFNTGYTAPIGDALIRQDLCAEATRLTRILMTLLEKEVRLTENAEVIGLLALMLLHDSRSGTRVDTHGQLIPLEEQNRDLWDADKIAEGVSLVEQALAMRRAGPYQIQASIVALHAEANTPDETDWAQIAVLYGLLYRMHPSPIVTLNRAVAVAMAEGFEQGLRMLDELAQDGELEDYYLLHASRADLLRRLTQWDAARTAYIRALELCQNDTERAFLRRRLTQVDQQIQP